MGIDLKGLVQNVFTIVSGTLNDVGQVATYRQFASSAYNPTTGTVVTTYATTAVENAIVVGYKNYERETNPNIQAEDQKLLVAYNNLPIVPTVEDRLTLAGKEWAVKDYRKDPSTSLWIFQIGAPGG